MLLRAHGMHSMHLLQVHRQLNGTNSAILRLILQGVGVGADREATLTPSVTSESEGVAEMIR